MTPKQEREEIDARVFGVIRKGPKTAGELTDREFALSYNHRDIDRSLQRLKRAGKIKFDPPGVGGTRKWRKV